MYFPRRIIQKLSVTLSLPNIGSLATKRRTAFDESEAGLDWNERNASSVLQVRIHTGNTFHATSLLI